MATDNALKRSREDKEEGAFSTPRSASHRRSLAHSRSFTDPTNHDESNATTTTGANASAPGAPDAPSKKKQRKLPHEKLYLDALPASPRYSKSLMHKSQLAFVTVTPHTDFLITASVDGVVKFWKKMVNATATSAADGKGDGSGKDKNAAAQSQDVEFVKQYRAHKGEITGVSASVDGRGFASAATDNTIKIFDVTSFGAYILLPYTTRSPLQCQNSSLTNGCPDLLAILSLKYTPRRVCWAHQRGAPLPLLAVTDDASSKIDIFDGRGENPEPLYTTTTLHRAPVCALAYNAVYNCAISADEAGMVEYWRPPARGGGGGGDGAFSKPDNVFALKSSTNLFVFRKAKSRPASLTVSPDGQRFASFSFPDRQVRVFDFASGRLYRSYDESLATLSEMHQAGTALFKLDDIDFGRRMAVERGLDEHESHSAAHHRVNVVFDESGHFILYGSLMGIKCINTYTNKVVRVFGKDEGFRALNIALYQGQPLKKDVTTVSMAASANPLLAQAEQRDALLASTGHAKVRFYMFTNDTEITKTVRDVQNEKLELNDPEKRAAVAGAGGAGAGALVEADAPRGTGAVLHTSLGDIHLRLYPSAAPQTVENFVVHARNGYYNGTIFHRVIRKFMVQGGDPLGDGTGGESIWGGDFADEISSLKHDRAYTLSMANAGPNTNRSQFFITTNKTPWLDGKHTIFGRAVKGMDVVHRIENVKTFKEKPVHDVRIVSITIT